MPRLIPLFLSLIIPGLGTAFDQKIPPHLRQQGMIQLLSAISIIILAQSSFLGKTKVCLSDPFPTLIMKVIECKKRVSTLFTLTFLLYLWTIYTALEVYDNDY